MNIGIEETEAIKHFDNFLRAYENLITKGRYFDYD